MTTRLLLATVFLCGIVVNAHAQAARLFVGGPLFVTEDATSIFCSIHNAGAAIQPPLENMHLVDENNNRLEDSTTCSPGVPLNPGNSCSISVQNNVQGIVGRLITCTVLATPAAAGGPAILSGTVDVREEESQELLYVIPLQPTTVIPFQ